MKPVTRDDLAKRYGMFLGFLLRSGRFDPRGEPGSHVTPGNIERYVLELKHCVSSVTAYGAIVKLRRVAQILAPQQTFDWLRGIEKELYADMVPQPKFGRLVLTEVLVKAGLTLMSEADTAANLTALKRACLFRNGLMVALLACCPIRLKNFASLEIGRSFVEIGRTWWIVLSAAETKEDRPDERPVPSFLKPAIEAYLRVHRPVLARAAEPCGSLWLSSQYGVPMKQCMVGEVLTETTYSTVGVRVSPHLFRTSVASTAAVYAPDKPHLASALLHHAHPAVTEQHYNRAGSMAAGAAYAAITETYRNSDD